ncbi:hypothetical protein GWK47_034534 [Chionoecetes opilio]|uniref:Uncharacterized protein n=1 Tax=Chionoecetes opilio TaxID=41210 RepID=A0A8J4YR85_CHIOP|nr:hypothetical protein GWK47_034534 [Chionoecetes opilio]
MEDKSEELRRENSKLMTDTQAVQNTWTTGAHQDPDGHRQADHWGPKEKGTGVFAGLNPKPRSSGPVSFGFSSFDTNKSMTSPVDMLGSANGSLQVTSLRNELQVRT